MGTILNLAGKVNPSIWWAQFESAPRAGSTILLTKGDIWQNHVD